MLESRILVLAGAVDRSETCRSDPMFGGKHVARKGFECTIG